jgi:hypothetical protein
VLIERKATAAFPFGRIRITPGAKGLHQADLATSLLRHIAGDWGELCDEDKRVNDEALCFGDGLLSSYIDRRGTRFFIITEADRSATTILLPEEY